MRSLLRRLRRFAPLAALLIPLACSSTEPSLRGSFTLQSLNETALPYDHEGLGCCTYLSGELTLDEGGYTMSLRFRNRNTQLVYTAVERGSYVQQGTSFSFAFESYTVAALGLTSGTLEGEELLVRFGGEGPGSPDQFRARFVVRE